MRKLSVFRQVSWLRRNIHRSLVIIDTKDSQSFSQSTEIFPRCLSSIRPIRVFSALDDTYVRGVSRFKVNFKNVFVGPRRKSLPTARFCNPRTLICWQDGLKSVDPPVPPRDPLYFLRLSGKNPRNDAGRIHTTARIFLSTPLPLFRGTDRLETVLPKRSISPRVRPKERKRSSIIADHVLVIDISALPVLAVSTRICRYRVTYWKHRSVETLGISRCVRFRWKV